MTIDLYTATGTKKGSIELPESVFAGPVRHGLMHQAVVLQQSNRRVAIANAKRRGEVQGSTRKLYMQKHTGRARRGAVRSPLLRGGGKSFGPRSEQNFSKNMPRAMRKAALRSCLSWQAKRGIILALENYPEEIKTKTCMTLLSKLPVENGRRTLFVMATPHTSLMRSSRNIPGVKTVTAAYLNPEDVIAARHIVFLADAIDATAAMFTKKTQNTVNAPQKTESPKKTKTPAKKTAKKSPKASS
jgi:large subunit ribosomal protein L4